MNKKNTEQAKNAPHPSINLLDASDDLLLQKIASDLEHEWEMSGLADGLYFDYAAEIAKRFYKKKVQPGATNHERN